MGRWAKWDQEQMEWGAEIIKNFRAFKTKDSSENPRKMSTLFKEGKKMEMTDDLFSKFTMISKEMLSKYRDEVNRGTLSVKSLVNMNNDDKLRQKKYAEIVKESGFKTITEVLETHPEDFTPEKIDKIPLRKAAPIQKDKFLEDIDFHGSIQHYSRSVFNPASKNMKLLLSEAETLKKELGR